MQGAQVTVLRLASNEKQAEINFAVLQEQNQYSNRHYCTL